jgi:hypothetical protein
MSESLYMMEIEQILENVSAVACRKGLKEGTLKIVKEVAIGILMRHYGLNLDDAQSEVAAAAGEEP